MKSRVKTYTRKETDQLCEDVWEETERCVNANGLVFVIALARHAGWGRKRIESFIATLNETMAEYHQHSVDGVFDEMAENELATIGLDIKQLMPKPERFKKSLQKSRNEKKVNVDYATAKQLHDNMVAVTNYLHSKENQE